MSDLPFKHVLAHQYTVFDGLAGMHIEDIYQDRQGFLWIATADGGVSRFDSARFDTFVRHSGLAPARRGLGLGWIISALTGLTVLFGAKDAEACSIIYCEPDLSRCDSEEPIFCCDTCGNGWCTT